MCLCPVLNSVHAEQIRPHVTPSRLTEYLREFRRGDVQTATIFPVKRRKEPSNRLGHSLGTTPKKLLKYSVKVGRQHKS
jgi:hypothetical protein